MKKNQATQFCKTPEIMNAMYIRWNPKIHHNHLKQVRDTIKTLLLCAHKQKWGFPQDVLYLVFDYVAQAYIEQLMEQMKKNKKKEKKNKKEKKEKKNKKEKEENKEILPEEKPKSKDKSSINKFFQS